MLCPAAAGGSETANGDKTINRADISLTPAFSSKSVPFASRLARERGKAALAQSAEKRQNWA
jgi:hypothetical protein